MAQGNHNAKPPEGYAFKEGDDPRRNHGGRTPTKWVRDFLDAACDKSPTGKTRRQRQAEAAYLRSLQCDVNGNPDPFIPAKDANEAVKVMWAYDMGKPVEAIEVTETNRPRVLFYLPAKGSKPQASAQPDDVKKDGGNATGDG